MPFMKGAKPIRRTLEYLTKGQILFKDTVKIMTVNFNTDEERDTSSRGARDFMFWYAPQIQYKNPDLQLVSFKDMTPSPFIRFYLEDGSKVLVDVDSKSKEEIHDHIKAILGKRDEVLQDAADAASRADNAANFGFGAPRWCICEVPGQLPCPGAVELPRDMRGKYRHSLDED